VPWPQIFLAVLTIGGGVALAGSLLVRLSGADWRTARRLAGAPITTVEDATTAARAGNGSNRPVQLRGRVRCPDPIITAAGERLAIIHRDVDVRLPSGAWRAIERIRDSRPLELWERRSSIALEPAGIAEPLVTLPQVWQGNTDELPADLQSAITNLAAREGPISEARAITRTISLVDQLIVLGIPGIGADGRPACLPPAGGMIVSNLELDEAMRLLGGEQPRMLTSGLAAAAIGSIMAVIGLVGVVLAAIGSTFA
jgi:hypothetical protein